MRPASLHDAQKVLLQSGIFTVFDNLARIAQLDQHSVFSQLRRRALLLAADFFHLFRAAVGVGAGARTVGAVGADDPGKGAIGFLIAFQNGMSGQQFQIVGMGADAQVGYPGQGFVFCFTVGNINIGCFFEVFHWLVLLLFNVAHFSAVVAQGGSAQNRYFRGPGRLDDHPGQGVPVNERFKLAAHGFLEKRPGFAHRSAQNNNFRIIGIEGDHHRLAEIVAEVIEYFQGLRVALPGPFVQNPAVHPVLVLEKLAAAVIFDGMLFVKDFADFTGAAIATAIQLAVDNNPRPQSGAQDHAHQVLITPAGAEIEFAEGEAIGVVVDMHRDAEGLFQNFLERHFFPGRDILHRVDDAFIHIHQAGDADADGRDLFVKHGGNGFANFLQHQILRALSEVMGLAW